LSARFLHYIKGTNMAKKTLKLNQIIAIANGEKSRTKKILTKLYQQMDKESLFSGLSKTYEPLDDEGEKLPQEDKMVQFNVKDCIKEVTSTLGEMINIIATQDVGNCSARADIIIDDKVLVEQVPVTHLLFLEKQIEDIITFINSLPTLDPVEKWSFNNEANLYVAEEKKTIRTKKMPEVIVKYEATKEHPAQTELIYVDRPEGYWHTIKFSGAISKKEKEELMDRVLKLQKAIKVAREEGNGLEVEKVAFGEKILEYIFS
jgi:hypothetical protein